MPLFPHLAGAPVPEPVPVVGDEVLVIRPLGRGPLPQRPSPAPPAPAPALPLPIAGRLFVYHPRENSTRADLAVPAASSIASMFFGHDRRCVPCWTTRLYFFCAADQHLAFVRVVAAGLLDVNVLARRRTARIAAGACQWSGVAIAMATTDLSSRIWW